MSAFLGIDTSCYTTSVALVDEDGQLTCEIRKSLLVEKGQRGLRQSEALFQHMKNLPSMIEEILQGVKLSAVCATTRPRPIADSYMPVFLSGEGFAKAVAAAADIPFYSVSHQEGHLFAAKNTSGFEGDAYLAIHLSGGTTELILVQETKNATRIQRLGTSLDVYAGQFIDRAGTAMGMAFPCGKAMSELAMKGTGKIQIPSSVKGLDCSFSGAETRAYQHCDDKVETAYAVLDCITRTIYKMLTAASKQTGLKNALLFGGVAESQFLREKLTARIQSRQDNLTLYFAAPGFSADNALGAALAAKKFYCGGNK